MRIILVWLMEKSMDCYGSRDQLGFELGISMSELGVDDGCSVVSSSGHFFFFVDKVIEIQ